MADFLAAVAFETALLLTPLTLTKLFLAFESLVSAVALADFWALAAAFYALIAMLAIPCRRAYSMAAAVLALRVAA